MDINSIQGANAYAANRPPADTTLVENQNQEAVATDLNQENTQAVQEAFQVNLTQEALDRQAADSEEAAAVEENTQAEQVQAQSQNQPAQGQGQPQVSQIVDIVA